MPEHSLILERQAMGPPSPPPGMSAEAMLDHARIATRGTWPCTDTRPTTRFEFADVFHLPDSARVTRSCGYAVHKTSQHSCSYAVEALTELRGTNGTLWMIEFCEMLEQRPETNCDIGSPMSAGYFRTQSFAQGWNDSLNRELALPFDSTKHWA